MKKPPMPIEDFAAVAEQFGQLFDTETNPKVRMEAVKTLAKVVSDDFEAMTPAERAEFMKGFGQKASKPQD
jgi:hypothetical protein